MTWIIRNVFLSSDLTVPIRLGESWMRQIPERWNLLGTRGTQEPGRLELHFTSIRDQLEQQSRRYVSISIAADLQLGRNFFCSLLVLNRNTLYTRALGADFTFPPTLVSTHNSDKLTLDKHYWIIIDWHDGRKLMEIFQGSPAEFYQNFWFPLCTRFSPNFKFCDHSSFKCWFAFYYSTHTFSYELKSHQ